MESTITIRRAVRADLSTVLRFHRELYLKHRDKITRPDVIALFAYRDIDTTLRDDAEGLLTSPDTWVLLADTLSDQGERHTVGYITGHIETDPRRVLPRRGVVEDWLVMSAARGQGAGKLLMNALEAIFREQRCDLMESGTWAFNEGARKAHARAGFTEIEVKMRKKL